MKKNKRIISLALALVLMFSFMALSASAATVEVPVVQPKGTCPSCTYGYMEEGTIKYKDRIDGPWSSSCPNMGAGHLHYLDRFYRTTVCRNCGYTYYYALAYEKEYCPYNGYV